VQQVYRRIIMSERQKIHLKLERAVGRVHTSAEDGHVLFLACYTVSQKSRPLSLSSVYQILTDFQNSFTDTLCGKPVIKWLGPMKDPTTPDTVRCWSLHYLVKYINFQNLYRLQSQNSRWCTSPGRECGYGRWAGNVPRRPTRNSSLIRPLALSAVII